MDKWEYRTIHAKEVGLNVFRLQKSMVKVDDYFNDLGRQGWEVIQFNFEAMGAGGVLAFLKRRRS